MEWVILFLINWIIFLFLVDWKKFKTNIWTGVLAIAMVISIDYSNIIHGRYIIKKLVVNVFGSSLFFLLGPVLIIGTLLAQYHPRKRWLTVLSVIVIFLLYSAIELILVSRGAVEYLDWHFCDSLIVNIGAISILSWFSIVILNKWGV